MRYPVRRTVVTPVDQGLHPHQCKRLHLHRRKLRRKHPHLHPHHLPLLRHLLRHRRMYARS